MRPTSPLSLFIFLRLVCTAPIVLPDCQSSACRAFISNPNTPPTRLTQPHFPSHQTASTTDTSYQEPFDNSPFTPPKHYQPAQALAVHQPLASAYLKSLENPASHPKKADSIHKGEETEALPAKPTSALPALRQEDARIYWATRTAEDASAADGLEGPKHNVYSCGAGRYLAQRTKMSRDYSDFLVVGIVLLFLAVIVALEAVEKVEGLRSLFTRRTSEGQIYLAEEESMSFIAEKSFSLQPAPPPKFYRISITEYQDRSGSESEVTCSKEYITEGELIDERCG